MDFMRRLAKKREQEETARQLEIFREVVTAATTEEKDRIFKSIRSGSFEEYMETVEPIINRLAIVFVNTGEGEAQ